MPCAPLPCPPLPCPVTFTRSTEPHRRELLAHCVRMLGAHHQAEDAVQETYLRAWRNWARFEGRSSTRAWLYRIATNVCLDAIRRRRDVVGDPPELPAERDAEPDAVVVIREAVADACVTAVRLLPLKQRAALVAHDVYGWSARESAELLGTTEAAVNSALQRARVTLGEHRPTLSGFPGA